MIASIRFGAPFVLICALVIVAEDSETRRWSADERRALFAMSLSTMEPLASDPSNRVADDPRAAALGHRLFFDRRLSATGTIACATCHEPARDFQDGRPTGHGVGVGDRRTMPVAGTARGSWFFWDGRADSPWAQALGPLENPIEHGATRALIAHEVAARYASDYAAIFGAPARLDGVPRDASPVGDSAARVAWSRIPPAKQDDISRVYANVGKAIAAYERHLEFGRSRVDVWIDAEREGKSSAVLTSEEIAGARLFVGRARCATCHTGARLTDDAFHNTGVALAASVTSRASAIDSGRRSGARQAIAGEFSCTSRYSDANGPDACGELRFADTSSDALVRAYKTPSLRNVGQRAPFMHAGQLLTLGDVIAHYDRAARAPAGTSELRPLRLSVDERRQLEAFLRALDAPPTARPIAFLHPPVP